LLRHDWPVAVFGRGLAKGQLHGKLIH